MSPDQHEIVIPGGPRHADNRATPTAVPASAPANVRYVGRAHVAKHANDKTQPPRRGGDYVPRHAEDVPVTKARLPQRAPLITAQPAPQAREVFRQLVGAA